MIFYGWLFIGLILLSLSFSMPDAPDAIYLLLFASLLIAAIPIFIPLRLFSRIAPFSIPVYLIFIHLFLSYTGGTESPYRLMYFMPLIFASILYRYTGTVITLLLIFASHLAMEQVSFSNVLPYLASKDFLGKDLPIFIIAILIGVKISIIATMLEEDRDTIYNLFGHVEKAKKEWETSFDAVNDIIFILDKEQNIVKTNMAAAKKLKKSPKDLVGKKCYALCHGSDSPIPNCPHVKSINTGKPSMLEIEEPYIGGIFEVNTYPLFDDKENIQGSVHYMKDITARKTAEKAREREFEVTRILHNTDKAILSTTDKQEMIKLCITNCKALVDADYISIASLDPEKNEFKLEASSFFNLLSIYERRIPFDSTILKSAISSRVSRYCPDIMDEDLLQGDGWLKDKNIKSIIIIPLIAKGEPIGVLNIGSLKKNRFGPRDIELSEQYALQIAIALDNANLYEGMQSLFMNTVTSLSAAMDAKSPWTQNHSTGASTYAIAIARELGLDETFIDELKLAVLLHDIGKIGIDNTILNKQSRLSEEEFRIVKEHPLKGAGILGPIKELKEIIPIIRHHHEWWDGTGYPYGLAGNMIPLGARILCVADAFDAMTAERPYRKGLTLEEAKQELIRFAGSQFDPTVVDAFIKVINREEKVGNTSNKFIGF